MLPDHVGLGVMVARAALCESSLDNIDERWLPVSLPSCLCSLSLTVAAGQRAAVPEAVEIFSPGEYEIIAYLSLPRSCTCTPLSFPLSPSLLLLLPSSSSWSLHTTPRRPVVFCAKSFLCVY